MNDRRLDSLLREAAESEPSPNEPSTRLADNVLNVVAQRQVRRRWLMTTFAVIGAYGAGLLTMWAHLPEKNSEEPLSLPQLVVSHEQQNPPVESKATGSINDAAQPRVAEEQKPIDAVLAETPRPEKKSVYQFFRELGDASHSRGDVASSVRYYRLALGAATAQELQPEEIADNLLLLSLKQDRLAAIQPTKEEESL